jgi:acetyl esterase
MPIDPCYRELLADPRVTLRPPPPHISVSDLRKANERAFAGIVAPQVHEVATLMIAGAAPDTARAAREITDAAPNVTGAAPEIALRLYRPSAAGDLPVILYFHGGGFVLCSIETHDALCRELALDAGAAVVSVDYRRAPESPFPGPPEDCHAALAWIAAHAAELGFDPARIAVCGDSAGGNLAIATAMLARERGPLLCHMGLIYPMIDPACDSPSACSLADGPVITRDILRWFWQAYLGEHGRRDDPLAAVLQADLAGLPAATVLTAEYDPLRDEGEAFAGRLRACGIPVVCRRYLGMVHGFANLTGVTPVARRALSDLGSDLKTAFTGGASG